MVYRSVCQAIEIVFVTKACPLALITIGLKFNLLQIIAVNLDVTFPCVNYMGEVEPAPEWSRDPLRALIDGKLAKEDGTSIDVIFL